MSKEKFKGKTGPMRAELKDGKNVFPIACDAAASHRAAAAFPGRRIETAAKMQNSWVGILAELFPKQMLAFGGVLTWLVENWFGIPGLPGVRVPTPGYLRYQCRWIPCLA